MSGKLITFEGIEGAGKSTVVARTAQYLAACNIPVEVSREPGGTPLAERIRTLLLDPQEAGMPASCELLLVWAARADHLARRVGPALERGAWVVLDRFTDATYAYQGGGRGIPDAEIAALERLVHPNLKPDLTVLLDIPVTQGLQRSGTAPGSDRFENERGEFFARVRAAYRARAAAEPERVRVLDAAQPLDVVFDAVRALLATLS